MSLKSDLPAQIDWALSRLVLLTANHRDQGARDFTLDSVPGLADALLSYVRRVHAALTGQSPSKWEAAYFEQPSEARDVGIGAPGDGGHQGISTLQQTSISTTHTPSSVVKHSGVSSHSTSTFNPSGNASHAALMRRALEAALSLRNLTTHSSNARSLASMKGIFGLIRDILRLPITATQSTSNGRDLVKAETEVAHEDGWTEIEGIAELRLYFLDILEALAAKVSLTRRAAGVASTTSLVLANGFSSSSTLPKSTKDDSNPGDDIFAVLISLAKDSNDRAFLLGSVRCLTTMAAIERNEAAFIEVTQPNGEQSPGLLQRCVELLPLTQDTELLEAVLDLLYQLVCLGNNAIKIAAALGSEGRRSSREGVERNSIVAKSAAQAASARATAKTAAMIRLLSRNLQLGRTTWERVLPLKVPQQWVASVPSRQAEAMRRKRESQIKLANETPQQRAARKKLTKQERRGLLGLKEPDRGIAWMKLVFQRNPESEVTQMEFWTAYKEEFGQHNDGVPLAQAAELIRAVSHVFPQAAAMVVPPQNGQPQRFVIKGIEVKERDRDVLEPYRCQWATCSAPDTNSLEAQKGHARLHVEYAPDGRCGWKRCSYDAKQSGAGSAEEQKEALKSHVLTHFKSDASTFSAIKAAGRTSIVVDDDLRIVSGAEHTGEAATLTTTKTVNGARVLRGKRDADGVETTFTMDKIAGGRGGAQLNGARNGSVAPASASPRAALSTIRGGTSLT